MIELPNISDNSLDEAKERKEIKDYLYTLTEQLRFTLNNLDGENFNPNFLNQVMEAGDGSYTQLQQDIGGIRSKVKSLTDDVSEVEQTAEGLRVRVNNAAGSITQLELTTSGLALAVNNQKLRFDRTGLSIYNGGLTMYNSLNQPVLAADTQGNLEMTGRIMATSGQLGKWVVNNNGLAYGTNIYMAPAMNPAIKLNNFYVSDDGVGYISSTYDNNWSITAMSKAVQISANATINLSAGDRLNLTSPTGRLTHNGYTIFTGELIQAGTVVISAGSWTKVIFNKPFSAGNPPKVCLTPNDNVTGVIGVKVTSVGNDGFLATVNTENTASVTCNWIAVRT